MAELNEWDRMTVGNLIAFLEKEKARGAITDTTEVWVDSDPEGNGTHPMRNIGEPAPVVESRGRTILDDEATEVALPAQAVWFGVGY